MTLEARDQRLLTGLRLRPRKHFAGRVRGERSTTRKGISIEFADYRDYSDGDDLRHLDWNVLARLDTPVMRTYRDEEDLAVHLLLDASPSMDFGEPTKLDMAKHVAEAIHAVAANGGDTVHPLVLGSRARSSRAGMRGRASRNRYLAWSREIAVTEGRFAEGLRTFARSALRTGMVVIISDGMDPDAAAAIRQVAGRGHEVWFHHVLSSLDLDPDLEGDLRLVDSEGFGTVELTANSDALRRYKKALDEHCGALRDAVTRSGGRYAQLESHWPLERVIRDVWKRDGWVA
jgi:uncharacterized protein (DUF58 family)